MRGFRNVSIYPRRPNLSQARNLANGQQRGGDGVFYCSNRAPSPARCQVVQANLRNIGLNMDIRLFPRATQFELAGRKGEPFDMTLEGWHMDYFDPYDFIFLVDGTTIRPANNVNFSYFNSAAFNRKIARAKTLVGVPRYRAFSNLDQDLVRNGAPLATYSSPNDRHYVSSRVGRSRLNGKGRRLRPAPFHFFNERTRSTSGKLVTPHHQTQERRECTDI